MDRNQIFGLLLIAGLLLIYIEFLAPRNSSKKEETQKQTTTQTTTPTPSIDSVVLKKQQSELGVLAPTTSTTNNIEPSFENENIKVVFSTIGGRIKSVLLKNYFTSNHKPLYLVNEKNQLGHHRQRRKGDS
jgi:YidC/Oxa1 family membrane protein insertase